MKSDKHPLDLLDAVVYTDRMDKDLAVVVDHGDKVELSLAVGQLKELVPEMKVKGGTLGCDPCEVTPEDRCNPLVWVLISTNAKYEPKAPKNHWVPGFFQEQLSPQEYSRLTEKAIDSLSERIDVLSKDSISGLKKQLKETVTLEHGISEFEQRQIQTSDSFEELAR